MKYVQIKGTITHGDTRIEHKPRAVGVDFSIFIVITQPGILTTTIKTHKSRHQPNKYVNK